MSTTIHSSNRPSANPDGTLTAHIEERFAPAVGFGLLRVIIPFELPEDEAAGHYFLARCGAQSQVERATQWGIYFRRPLFLSSYRQLPADETIPPQSNASHSTAAQPALAECEFVVPYQPFISSESYPFAGIRLDHIPDKIDHALSQISDPGYAWLAALDSNQPVNLMGPFGNGFDLGPDCRNLLLVANGGTRTAKLLPLIEAMLNRGGRVTIVIKTSSVHEQEALQAHLLPRLPIAVELRFAHVDKSTPPKAWQDELNETLPWADQVCAALPESDLNELTMRIRDKRFHQQEGFAQILVDADLICGVGACLACVVNTANGGHTRACVNGPVFDLTRLSR